LRNNSKEDEVIVHWSNVQSGTFVITVVVSEDSFTSVDKDDLLKWSCDDLSSSARYGWQSGETGIWIERGTDWTAESLRDAQQLVFPRYFEGLEERDAFYCELLQEYTHLTDTHWRPEQRAYCRFDENGDFDHIVSVSANENRDDVTLVSFKREPLEQFLAASNSVMVRLFDFTLLRRGKDFEFSKWPSGPEDVIRESESLFYRQKVDPGKAAYTCGVQIIPPSRPKSAIFASMKEGPSTHKEGPFVEFIALDWRNKRITRISTDPDATTNYFQASENSLPTSFLPHSLGPMY
jgi:hypothetical protein